jgi:hypothetical protein
MEAGWFNGEDPEAGTFYEPLVSVPDERGHMEFIDLAPGQYDVFMGDFRQRVEVQDGETGHVSLRAPTGRLRGRVEDGEGNPLARAALYPLPKHREETPLERAIGKSYHVGLKRYSSSDGSFVVDVSPGAYVLHASHPNGDTASSSIVTVRCGEVVEGILLELSRGR